MSKKNKKICLILVDEKNSPHTSSFFGITHTLLLQYAQKLEQEIPFELIFIKPPFSKELLSKVAIVIDRTLIYSLDVQQAHAYLQRHKIPFLNDPGVMELFASKWKTYNFLNENDILVPNTIRATSVSEINKFLKTQNGHIVVKPEWGSAGTNVFFIKSLKEFNVECFWKEKKNGITTPKKFSGRIEDFYKKYMENPTVEDTGNERMAKIDQWIAQEYLDISHGGIYSDIRIVEQRDHNGVLQISSIHGRQSRSAKVPLTNLDKKGIVISFDKCLQDTDILAEDIISYCRNIDSTVESKYGKFGEIGHDIALVKKNGKYQCVYIEGNTMPGYIFENWDKIMKVPDINNLTINDILLIARPLEYVLSLVGVHV